MTLHKIENNIYTARKNMKAYHSVSLAKTSSENQTLPIDEIIKKATCRL